MVDSLPAEVRLFLLLIGLACLFPISLYCLFLALIHHRRSPTVLSGPWDFAAVLIALSGFLLFGGSTLLFAFHTAARDSWLSAATLSDLRTAHATSGAVLFLLWGGYGALLLLGSLALLYRRRDFLVGYNIAPAEVELILVQIFEDLGFPWDRRGSRYYAEVVESHATDSPEKPRRRKLVVDIDGSPAMHHATLYWVAVPPEIRREVEAELIRRLAGFSSPPSGAGGWFLTAAGSLMILMIFILLTFLIVAIR